MNYIFIKVVVIDLFLRPKALLAMHMARYIVAGMISLLLGKS